MAKAGLVAKARRLGISPRYRTEAGEDVTLSDDALSALIEILEPFGPLDIADAPPAAKCPVLPRGRRIWGVTCQLYGLQSPRNAGIGDFADLATLGEALAACGADFIGLNPLHALFSADPGKISPYSPSTRRFLNPLYLALDWIDSGARPRRHDDGDLVDYRAVSARKAKLLRTLFDDGVAQGDEFTAFCDREGDTLHAFAVFETLSARHAEDGAGAGWHNWPEDQRTASPELVAQVASEHPRDVAFHKWLQFLADAQLARVQQHLHAAGMAVGIYLDVAIGVASDGFDTWSEPDLTTPLARIGSPPDPFNAQGQDWGLAPIVPSRLVARDFVPYRDTLDAVMRHAGAVRIDHAMALERLWWIPEGQTGEGGGYVRYPFAQMAATVAEAATEAGTLVIGEDLGTVPQGFRARAAKANIHSYRVLFFEKDEAGFTPPARYPTKALASISTHDLPTLAGWWSGRDISVRSDLGLYDKQAATHATAERKADKRELVDLLDAEGLSLGKATDATRRAASIHALAARSRSALFAVQLEDLLGLEDQPNLPGTVDEHPNWRRRYPVPVAEIAADPVADAVISAVSAERPKAQKP